MHSHPTHPTHPTWALVALSAAPHASHTQMLSSPSVGSDSPPRPPLCRGAFYTPSDSLSPQTGPHRQSSSSCLGSKTPVRPAPQVNALLALLGFCGAGFLCGCPLHLSWALTPTLGHHGSLLLFCCHECHLAFCDRMALGLNFSDRKRKKEKKQMIVWNPKLHQNSITICIAILLLLKWLPTSPRAKAKVLITIFSALLECCLLSCFLSSYGRPPAPHTPTLPQRPGFLAAPQM